MGDGVVVRPDQVSLGVLVSAVPRDAVDEAVAVCGVREKRSDAKLPAHVITYLMLGSCLFREDDYEEVATRVAGPVELLERGMECADGQCDHPGPETVGPQRVPGTVRTYLRPGCRRSRSDRRGRCVGHRAWVVPAPVAAAGHRRVRYRRARAVKRARHNSYRIKKPTEPASTHHPAPATINIRGLTPRAA